MTNESNTARRNRDFIRACALQINHDLERGRQRSHSEIVAAVLKEGAPEYYLTFDTAYRLLKPHHPGPRRRHDAMSELRMAEVRERINELRERRPETTFSAALARVLCDGRASQFFISHDRGMRLFNNYFSRNLTYSLHRQK